jgi:hypothetical protein
MPAPSRDGLRGLADDYAAIVLSAIALVWLALEGGGYGEVARHAAGAVVWLFLFGLLLRRGGALPVRGPVLAVAGAIAAFALVTALSLLWTESSGRTWDEVTRVLTYLGLFLAVTTVGSDARRRGQLLEGLTLGMVVVVVLALLSRLEPGLFHAQELGRLTPEFRPRLAFPFDYWNAVGSFAAVTFVLLVHAASRADRPRWYGAAAAALLPVAGLTLYLSFSRGGFLSAGVGCALFLWLSPRRLVAGAVIAVAALSTALLALLVRSYSELNDGLIEESAARSQGHRVLVALVALAALAFALRWLSARSRLAGRAVSALRPHRRKVRIAGVVVALAAAVAMTAVIDGGGFDDPIVTGTETADQQRRLTSISANGRYQLWSSAWDAWESRPVGGRGAGTYEFWWRRHADIDAPSRDSHSLVFDVLAELGTLGLLALLALFGTALWFASAAVRAATGAARASLVAVVAAMSTWALGAAVDWLWEFAAVGAVFFVLAGLAAAARRDQLAPVEESERVEGRRTNRTAALALAAWLVVVIQSVALIGSWSLARSEDAVARNDLATAEDAANLARRLEPWGAEPYMQRALVRVRSAAYRPSAATFAPAIADARKATEREPTNWRAWLTLVRIEARAGQLAAALRDTPRVTELAPKSALVPKYQDLLNLSNGTDTSLSPGY